MSIEEQRVQQIVDDEILLDGRESTVSEPRALWSAALKLTFTPKDVAIHMLKAYTQ
jgi:hypothetical protein